MPDKERNICACSKGHRGGCRKGCRACSVASCISHAFG
ncbi:hypothetical protein SLEP1_g46475 [Rubroshorea leprosula]|uniref:Metallothionein n=1 Tax=Rubroshorea leprosula TaxID=152421 RepID=A0AAV5LMB9_9ROSI|nr:hypothetical protein SLEP1_g46475 [Rubroshorea leprosula]